MTCGRHVGQLPGNINLLPHAEPDDGRLDVYVASPHRITHGCGCSSG